MKTNIKIISIDTDDKPATEYLPGAGDIPRLKDPALIGEPCIIYGSLLLAERPYTPLMHEVMLEDGRRFVVDPDQLGVIE